MVILPFAILLGIAAGYFRGWVDDVIQYLYTTLSSIPGVLLIAAAALMLEVYMAKHAADYTSLAARADLKLLALCMILGVTTWTGLCRYLRGEALKLRELDFIEAARAFGVPHSVIIARHIVPNIRRAKVTETTGEVTLELEGSEDGLKQAVIFLEKKGVKVDPVVGDIVSG